MKMVTRLESVGNVIDEHGVTYPMLVNGGYDIFAGVHVNDIEAPEFFEALSDEDWKVVNQFYVYDHSIDIRDPDEPDIQGPPYDSYGYNDDDDFLDKY